MSAHRITTTLLAGVALAFSAAPLAARQVRPDSAQRDTTVFKVDELLVRARRTGATAGGASALEVRPDSLRLAPSATLDEVLRTLPLLKIRTNSRGEAEPALRGVESRHVAVLMDGVPISLGWDHRTDLGVIPMAAAEQVTLLRGMPSMLHGPNVLGGVIEVGVGRGANGPLRFERPGPLEARAALDHLGGRALAVTGGHAAEGEGSDIVFRGGAGYRERAGVRAPAGVEATTDGLRENSDLRQFDGFLSLRYQHAGGGWLSASASGYRGERGVTPELHVAKPRFWRYPENDRLLAAVTGGTGHHTTPLGTGDLEASVGLDLGRTLIDSYASRAYQEIVGTEAGHDRTASLRLLGDHTVGRQGELRAAFTYVDINHRETIDAGTPNDYRQRLWSGGVETIWRLAPVSRGGWLAGTRLSAGLARDGADTPESGDKPPLGELGAWGGRVGVSTVAPGGTFALHAGLGRRARFPALRELYSGSLGKFVPNPTLRPERLTAVEGGVSAKLGGTDVQGVLFHQRLADVIVKASTGDGRLRRENRDEMRSTGVELLTGWRVGASALTADLTLQRVRILDPSTPTGERRAEYEPSLLAKADWTVPLPLEVRGTVAASYVGRQWCVHPDRQEEMALGSTGRLDLEAARSWGRFGATIALDNVADTAIYDQCGLPQPGRMLRFQVRVR